MSDQFVPGHAPFILQRLLAEGRITQRDIAKSLEALKEEMRAIEERLAHLKGIAPHTPGSKPASRTRATKPAKRKPNASHQLQGRYIAYLRQLPKSKRRKFQALAKKSGREAAITAMQAALRK